MKKLFIKLFNEISQYFGFKLPFPQIESSDRNFYDLEKDKMYINFQEKNKKELKYMVTEEFFHYFILQYNKSIKTFLLSEDNIDEKIRFQFILEVVTKFCILDFYKSKNDKKMVKYITYTRITNFRNYDKYKKLLNYVLTLDFNDKRNREFLFQFFVDS